MKPRAQAALKLTCIFFLALPWKGTRVRSVNAKTSPAPTRSTLTAVEIKWSKDTLDRAIVAEGDERGRFRWTWTLNETIGSAQTWYVLNEDLLGDAMFDNAKRVLKTFLSEPFIDGTMQVSFSRNRVKIGKA